MKLEIGQFYVKKITFGKKTFFLNGVLTLNKKELLDFVKMDKRITEADKNVNNRKKTMHLERLDIN